MFIAQWEKPERTKFIMLVWSSDAVGMAPSNPGLEKIHLTGSESQTQLYLGGKKGVLFPALVARRVLAMVSACMAPASMTAGTGSLVQGVPAEARLDCGSPGPCIGHGRVFTC